MVEAESVGEARRDLRWVIPLSATVMVGFGVILYGFSIYVTEAAAGGEFTKSVLSLAYGGSVFVGGALAVPVGRYADRRGVRAIIATGAILGSAGLVGFALSTQPWQVIGAWWLLLGPAQAMIYYEPAYVAINQWAPAVDRARLLATVTLIGGLAGIVFIPAAERLVSVLGWRQAVLVFSITLLAVGVVTAGLSLPRQAQQDRRVEPVEEVFPLRSLLSDRRYLWYSLGMACTFLAVQAAIAHNIARFEETGFPVSTVALWAAIASVVSLPGRWVAPILAGRVGAIRVQAVLVVIVATGVLLMFDGRRFWQMAGHFTLFGLAFGGILSLRAMVMAEWFTGPGYGRVMGAQWTATVVVGAAGPAMVGLIHDSTGGYQLPVAILTAMLLIGTVTILASGRAQPFRAPEAGP